MKIGREYLKKRPEGVTADHITQFFIAWYLAKANFPGREIQIGQTGLTIKVIWNSDPLQGSPLGPNFEVRSAGENFALSQTIAAYFRSLVQKN